MEQHKCFHILLVSHILIILPHIFSVFSTCTANQWSCIEKDCPGTCSVEGGSHITTFDGTTYNFHGDCTYILAEVSMTARYLLFQIIYSFLTLRKDFCFNLPSWLKISKIICTALSLILETGLFQDDQKLSSCQNHEILTCNTECNVTVVGCMSGQVIANAFCLMQYVVDQFLAIQSMPQCFQTSILLVYHTLCLLPQDLSSNCIQWCFVVVVLLDQSIVTCRI